MDIPRGHAMLPLNETDFLDFIYNYFKAEYAPIRSFFSTATAEPSQPSRWISMGHELAPLTFRAANAQAQKDLESLDYFVRRWNLDAGFVRGLVIRFAKYEVHERLEKKLFESSRLDLMVRKALKEKHLIDALWPSPAPKNIEKAFLQQGVQVRSWYGDMFSKYFKVLHSLEDFKLRPDVQSRITASSTLMLVPFVDHLIFGAVDPIVPIIAKGAGYANAAAWKQKDRGQAFGEPDQFDIRFDAPADVSDTHTRSVVRQCKCMKCGTRRDVKVVISVDPYPGPATSQSPSRERRPSNPNTSARRHSSKAAQKYSPGYAMPGAEDVPPVPRQPSTDASPVQKKQCPRCTFLNHPDLTSCEMCSADLPDTLVAKPPSPVATSRRSKPSHSQSKSESLPPPVNANRRQDKAPTRPPPANRNSLSSTLFSIFPFSQQQQTEHHPNLPPTQEGQPAPKPETTRPRPKPKEEDRPPAIPKQAPAAKETDAASEPEPAPARPSTPPHLIDAEPEPTLNQTPEMAMMPMTPPPTSSRQSRQLPSGLPQNLMDDFVPVSPSYRNEEDEEDAGWGEMSREEAKRGESDHEEEEDVTGRREGFVDLDEVAREEMGVWGDKDDD